MSNVPATTPSNNPIVALLGKVEKFDPVYIAKEMQKWLPMMSGVDIAAWTKIQHQNMLALQAAAKQIQEVLAANNQMQIEIMQRWFNAAFEASKEAMEARNNFDASAKQVEFTVSQAGKLTLEQIETLHKNAEMLSAISTLLGQRCTEAIEEMKAMAEKATKL
jgi:hypothetical protein